MEYILYGCLILTVLFTVSTFAVVKLLGWKEAIVIVATTAVGTAAILIALTLITYGVEHG